jgi:ribose 5-phosphate isomerase B
LTEQGPLAIVAASVLWGTKSLGVTIDFHRIFGKCRRGFEIVKIIIGSDHAGFELKETCKGFLEDSGQHELLDVGVFSRASSDYPQIAHKVARAVADGDYERGLLICGSGIGMSIVANRYKGVRAALCHNLWAARMSRLHNDANLLTMGERVLGQGLALDILDVFLKTAFEGGRHQARLDQIEARGGEPV